MCLYHQTRAYYTCCPRIKIVKVSEFWRILAQFCLLAVLAQLFWPLSPVKAHDAENDVYL